MIRDPLAMDIMSKPVRRVTADTTVRDAADFLLRHGISGAAVVDEKGRWVGAFTLNDIARHVQNRLVELPVIDPREERTLEGREPVPEGFHFEGFEDTRVRDLMTSGLYSVFPEATLEEVVRTLTHQKIHRVFVISEAGELLGVITSMDVLRWIEERYAKARSLKDRKAV